MEESFISPLVALRPPARFYYLFGAPITTAAEQAEDRQQVEATYGRVKSEVGARAGGREGGRAGGRQGGRAGGGGRGRGRGAGALHAVR